MWTLVMKSVLVVAPRLYTLFFFSFSFVFVYLTRQFDKSAYDESVPRDLEVGKLVMRIAATDVDAGENAHISYAWDAGSGPDAEYFDLDKSTGAIHLKKKITVFRKT